MLTLLRDPRSGNSRWVTGKKKVYRPRAGGKHMAAISHRLTGGLCICAEDASIVVTAALVDSPGWPQCAAARGGHPLAEARCSRLLQLSNICLKVAGALPSFFQGLGHLGMGVFIDCRGGPAPEVLLVRSAMDCVTGVLLFKGQGLLVTRLLPSGAPRRIVESFDRPFLRQGGRSRLIGGWIGICRRAMGVTKGPLCCLGFFYDNTRYGPVNLAPPFLQSRGSKLGMRGDNPRASILYVI